MKTIRQVKTVFVIFIAFVCCWSPYIVVLLYDNSDSLPLPVHLYASMLAHLHASLNFGIYGLINRDLLIPSVIAHLLARCCALPPGKVDVTSGVVYDAQRRSRREGERSSRIDGCRVMDTAAEYHQLQEMDVLGAETLVAANATGFSLHDRLNEV